MKRNVLQSKVAVQDEIIFTLAATALHLDKGSFDSVIHHDHYFDPRDYVPNWVSRFDTGNIGAVNRFCLASRISYALVRVPVKRCAIL